jgi:hypothetical protein
MSSLVAAASLREFFRHLLLEVGRRQHLEIQETTEFYVVNLLSEFADSGKLFSEVDGRPDVEPLAMLYHRALQQDRGERIRTFRRLGDVSLYRAGFFAPSILEAGLDPDYYVQMGGAAYGQVAALAPSSGFTGVYKELETKFRNVVDVLEEIAARGLLSNGPQGALRVYEAWSRSGNERLGEVLVEAGLVPPKGGLPN